MSRIPSSMKSATRLLLVATILLLVFGTLSFAQGYRYKGPDAWKFGVHGDTQWTLNEDPAGENPEFVNVSVIKAINKQMIGNNVRFVIQVGDLTDRAGDAGMAARAAAAQQLFNAGIGFFPLRGNHETYGYLYGRDPNYDLNVPAFKTSFPQTQGQGPNLFGAANFSSPSSTNDILTGLSYAYDYGNASFVIVDVEQTSVKHQAAPNNPASCVTAITTGATVGGITYGGAPEGSSCGQGYYYILSDLGNYNTGVVVYQAPQDIPVGITTNYDSAGVSTGSAQISIPTGTWFRIDSSGRPSTNFYAWDMQNPDQMFGGQPFDIYDPIDLPQNRVLETNSSAGTEFWPDKQQTWIGERLSKTDRNARGIDHAFVFSHRAIIAENHTDSFFGGNPNAIPDEQNAFFASMQDNDVKYMISGHDHLYNRALLTSPDANSALEQIVSIGASTKFYEPAALSAFAAGVKERETQIAQEVNTIGYYIYTVDGPRLNVDYYSTVFPQGITGFSDVYPYGEDWASTYPLGVTPPLNFVKKENFGYSLNGKGFVVNQGEPYTVVEDSFEGTEARILSGTNESAAVDGNDRPLAKAINTGWVPKPPRDKTVLSNILSLWGMGELGMESTDVYVLEMNYVDRRTKGKGRENGNAGIRLSGLDKNGQWVNAVKLNVGVKNARDQKFIKGPWKPGYKLGTYGIDMDKGTVWAVINYNADFAATQ